MSFSYNILKNRAQRVSLVSFHRATATPPKLNHPEIDDRGYFRDEIASLNPQAADVNLGLDRGPIVGVTEGDTVLVELRRSRISKKAVLFVTSSDPNVVKVTAARTGTSSDSSAVPENRLFPFNDQDLHITGVKGSGGVVPKTAKIEVRYGSSSGVVIGELTVYVFTRLRVNIVPHTVNLSGASGMSISHIFDAKPVFEFVRAIYQPVGIDFNVGAVKEEFIRSNLDQAGKWAYPEFESMSRQAKHHHPDAINVYFVDEIVSQNSEVIAFAPKPLKRLFKRCVIAQTNVTSQDHLAAVIAHEIGHFLDLDHTDKKDANSARKDIWSEDRMLMHPTVARFAFYPSLITLKDLFDTNDLATNHITDPEWLTLRRTINSKEGPYK